MRDESGFTLVEMLVAAVAGIVVMLAFFAMFDLASKNTSQVAQRVDADQRGKPVIQRLMDELHSACTGPGIAPVLAGSSPTQLSFQAQTGSDVAPTPTKRVVSLGGSVLTEQVFDATSGTNPTWTYSSASSSTRQLIAGVHAPPAGQGSVFAYYTANGGTIDPNPLPTPLSAGDAVKTVQVRVALQVDPSSTSVPDANASFVLSDAAVFRFSPFSEDPTKVNGPCA